MVKAPPINTQEVVFVFEDHSRGGQGSLDLNNGHLAMMSSTGMVTQELVTGA